MYIRSCYATLKRFVLVEDFSVFFVQIRAGKLEFFPLLHALALEDEEDETGKQLSELKTMVEKVLKRFEEEVRRANSRHDLIH